MLRERHKSFGTIKEGFRERSEYLNSGSAFAETVISGTVPHATTTINPTFFEGKKKYNMHYSLIPYNIFNDSIVFQVSADKVDPITIQSEHFKMNPVLANCIQQFLLWVSAAAKYIKQRDKVKFSFNSLNAAELCLNLSHDNKKFDVIYSSNIIDYLSPLVLVLAAIPLLEEGAVLMTSSMNLRRNFASIDKYLTTMFGFELKLLPIIFGIRCIGHEDDYSDKISICPIPPVITENPHLIMIWEKCSSSFPLKIESLSDSPEITKALYSVTKFAVRPGLTLGVKSDACTFGMCTETAIQAYLVFVSNLHPDVPVRSSSFWKCLCEHLKNDTDLNPFMLHIQTQAQLHGLHLHLYSPESVCIFCNVEVGISQFVADISVPEQSSISTTPYVIGQLIIDDHQVPSIIDSIACEKENDKLKVSLFIPSTMKDKPLSIQVHPNHNFTCSTVGANFSALAAHTYLFSTYKTKQPPCDPVFRIISHVGDGDLFLSKIVAVAKLQVASCRSLKLLAADSAEEFELVYPYPIDKHSLEITHNHTIIKVQRGCSHVYNEKPLFVATPMCFVPQAQPKPEFVAYYQYQISNDEPETSKCVKLIFQYFYETTAEILRIVDEKSPKIFCCIKINKRLLDIEKNSPAVFIQYKMNTQGLTQQDLESISQTKFDEEKKISSSAVVELEKMLQHFANRTFLATEHSSLTEAVVYPLYLQNVSKCGGCGKNTTRRCSCHRVAYCNKECQKKDWDNHKKSHKQITA